MGMTSEKKYSFWLDKIADDIITKRHDITRLKVLRVECGIGASGIPHIGSVSDALRSYGVKLALEDKGYKSELIVYADDRDGLRKVPSGLPSSLNKYLGFPVTDIPDPFHCHDSFGEHIESLFLDALDKLGIEYIFKSGTAVYKSGYLDKFIEKILLNAEKVREIDVALTKAKREKNWVYYWPVCENCGRIYTTFAYKVLPKEKKVLYRCTNEFKGVKGCGYEGEASYVEGNGKLAWKSEFAARWAAFNIVFEARGKDIEDSFIVNQKIAEEILGIEPPNSIRYELFLSKSGQKISKSIGNVFTPQVWFRYGSPESLRLIMFKRYQGTRKLGIEDIPTYMDEFDELEELYFNLSQIKNEREKVRIKRLYEYTNLLKPPPKQRVHIPYLTGVELIASIPSGLSQKNKFKLFLQLISSQFNIEIFRLYSKENPEIKTRFNFFLNWYEDLVRKEVPPKKLSETEINFLKDLLQRINERVSPEKVQELIFEIARQYSLQISKAFKVIYIVLIGRNRGPKISTYVKVLGVKDFIEILKKNLKLYEAA